MAKFTFDPAEHEPWQGSDHDTPADYALRLWSQFQNADEDMDFFAACDLAPYDGEVWEALFKAVQKQDVDAWPLAAQAALGAALAAKPLRRDAGVRARRNARLRAVAASLRRRYGMGLAQAIPGGPVLCAASVLATLPISIDEGQIANILTAKENGP